MKILLLITFVILLLKFPPGSNINWQLGSSIVRFPMGWCLWISLGASLLMGLMKKMNILSL